jgi:hypothetical protein
MLDLSAMKALLVNPERRRVRAGPGLTLGEFDRATQAFRLATTLGVVSTTGIAGLTLGGGLGWLNGRHGLACDNLISAEVATADGRLLRASAQENEDLFWSIQGGGGNFGVVTSFEYQLHPVDLVLAGEPTVSIAVCYCGPIAEGEQLLRPLRRFQAPVDDGIQPMPLEVRLAARGDRRRDRDPDAVPPADALPRQRRGAAAAARSGEQGRPIGRRLPTSGRAVRLPHRVAVVRRGRLGPQPAVDQGPVRGDATAPGGVGVRKQPGG